MIEPVHQPRRPASTCPPSPSLLKARGNSQGIGNRIGWYLTVAALAEGLGRRAVYTSWYNAGRIGHSNDRDYNFAAVDRLLEWPQVLKFVETDATVAQANRSARVAFVYAASGVPLHAADGSSMLKADVVPHHPRPYINDYVPECAWAMVSAWPRRKLLSLPPCLTREAFLTAFRRVQSQLRLKSSARLCAKPPARTYIVLHIRRGDKLRRAERELRGKVHRPRGSHTARALGTAFHAFFSPCAVFAAFHTQIVGERLANATSLASVINNALLPVVAVAPLPVVLLTDDGASFRAWAETELRAAGLRVLDRASAGSATSACDDGANDAAKGGGGASNDTPGVGSSVGRILSDFFTIRDAAGVVVIAPGGNGAGTGPQESSFASVAALAGDTPHLTPVGVRIGGKMATYRRCSKEKDHALRSIFFLEHVEAFASRVREGSRGGGG